MLESEPRAVPVRVRRTASLADVQAEMDEFYGEMSQFRTMPIVEVLQRIAGYSARMSHVRSLLNRSSDRMAAKFVTQEIDPFLDEVDRQFRTWSRVVTVVDQEFKQSGVM